MTLLGLETAYSLASLLPLRYGDKRAALTKCMVIFCLLLVFYLKQNKKKKKPLSVNQHCVSQWDCVVKLSSLCHLASNGGIKLIEREVYLYCVCILLLLWSNQPLLVWRLLCNWSRVTLISRIHCRELHLLRNKEEHLQNSMCLASFLPVCVCV